jgi:hypothetical protein
LQPQDFAKKLQATYEQHLKSTIQSSNDSDRQSQVFAKQLQETYERHLLSLTQNEKSSENLHSSNDCAPHLPQCVNSGVVVSRGAASGTSSVSLAKRHAASSKKPRPPSLQKQRTEEDKAAGSILLGLRQSYESAVRVRNWNSYDNKPSVSMLTNQQDYCLGQGEATVVTDSSSSQQMEGSVDDSDWNSDKKTDPSSSEDSDKDLSNMRYSKGPPRKRLKTKKLVDERKGSNSIIS